MLLSNKAILPVLWEMFPGHPNLLPASRNRMAIDRARRAGQDLLAGYMLGSLAAFEIDGGKEAAFRFQDALQLIRISNNLGDAKSLITHPATTTHQRLTPAQRAELGISDGLVRVSVGLEHPDDIVEDVLAALEAV